MDFGPLFDAAIGILAVMALFSLAVTAVQEALSQWFRQRPRTLEEGIGALLSSDVVARLEKRLAEASPGQNTAPPSGKTLDLEAFYAQPSIVSLMQGARKPSAIPPRVFAETVLDLLGRREELAREAEEAVRSRGERAAAQVRKIAEALGGGAGDATSETVLQVADRIAAGIQDAGTRLDREIAALETQFNDTMDRVGGWYARRTQIRLLVIGFVLAAGANIDLLGYAHQMLKAGPQARAAIVVAAAGIEEPPLNIAGLNAGLGQLEAPIGWGCEPADPSRFRWETSIFGCGPAADAAADADPMIIPLPSPSMLAGWVLIAFGSMLGAQFWFDLLKAAIKLRTSGKVDETPSAAKTVT